MSSEVSNRTFYRRRGVVGAKISVIVCHRRGKVQVIVMWGGGGTGNGFVVVRCQVTVMGCGIGPKYRCPGAMWTGDTDVAVGDGCDDYISYLTHTLPCDSEPPLTIKTLVTRLILSTASQERSEKNRLTDAWMSEPVYLSVKQSISQLINYLIRRYTGPLTLVYLPM